MGQLRNIVKFKLSHNHSFSTTTANLGKADVLLNINDYPFRTDTNSIRNAEYESTYSAKEEQKASWWVNILLGKSATMGGNFAHGKAVFADGI